MYCTKCGTKNDDASSFCFSCGSPLRQAVPPQPVDLQTPAPPVAVPSAGTPYVPKPQKPYRAEFTLGLVGAIIGAVIFVILAILGLLELLDEVYIDDFVFAFVEYTPYGMVAVSAAFCLAALILGFIGSSQINKGSLKGGVLLIIGSGLGFISMFFSSVTSITLFYWPLLLAGGITALARRSSLQKKGEYPY